MANGPIGAIKQTAVDLGEAIGKPVVDEVGKAIEEGAQSATGYTPKPLDPQEQQKKMEEDQKKKAWAIHVIEWNKKIQEEQAKIRQQQKQQEMQKTQQETEKKKVKQFQIMEQKQKQVQLSEAQKAATKAERKGGVGG